MFGIFVAENNCLAHVLDAVEANNPGAVDSWTEEQQVAIKEAYSGVHLYHVR